jgi:hypothetical protein
VLVGEYRASPGEGAPTFCSALAFWAMPVKEAKSKQMNRNAKDNLHLTLGSPLLSHLHQQGLSVETFSSIDGTNCSKVGTVINIIFIGKFALKRSAFSKAK